MGKKVKYTLDYPVRSSANILFQFLTTSSGFQEWFADKVRDEKDGFTFFWSGTSQRAYLVEEEPNRFVKYRWKGAPEDEYFEFRINKSEITAQMVLTVTDFAEKDDIEDAKQLWETQIKDLLYRIGA